MVPALRGLVCVILYPLEVGLIVVEPESIAVTPYQLTNVVLCNGLVVSLLVISPTEV